MLYNAQLQLVPGEVLSGEAKDLVYMEITYLLLFRIGPSKTALQQVGVEGRALLCPCQTCGVCYVGG